MDGQSNQIPNFPKFNNDIENFIEIEEQFGNIFGKRIVDLNQNIRQVHNQLNN